MCNLSEVLIEKTMEKGMRQGEERLGKLITLLIKNNKQDQIEIAATDIQTRKMLYKEYGI